MTDQPDAYPMPPDLGLHNLLRVIPVAQHQQYHDVSLLVYSLELHATGFNVVARLSWIGDSGSLPHLTWTASDDVGTIYRNFGCGGSGGGRPPMDGRPPTAFSWRLGCLFGGRMPTNATVLVLTATALGFMSATGSGDDQPPRLERTKTITGPWRFVIPLR